MNLRQYLPWGSSTSYDTLIDGLHEVKGDADAIALLPYDDGTFYLKPANFSKDLIGGIGGYETFDGDKIVVDGEGEAIRELFGVPMLLAVDPTEHAAAVDPVKAMIAHKNDIGEWLRVDRDGNVVQVGPALEPAPRLAGVEEIDDAMARLTNDELLALHEEDYDPKEWSEREKVEYIEQHHEAIRESVAEEYVDAEAELIDPDTEVSGDGIVGDGGLAGEVVEESTRTPGPELSMEEAMEQLAEQGDLTKIYDIAPPGGPYIGPDGEVKLEEATHIAVDQSKASNLLPTTMDTVELNTALDKARMEEHEEGKLMKYTLYGAIGGSVLTALAGGGMFLLIQLSGGVF